MFKMWYFCLTSWSMPRCGDRRQNLVHVQNVVFLFQSFLKVHTLTTTYQKPFILRTYVSCRVEFYSITSDPRVYARDGAGGQNLIHFQNEGFLRQSFLEVHTLTTTYQKSFILRPYVPCRVCCESMTSDPRVNARG